jgi:hypothetical protein
MRQDSSVCSLTRTTSPSSPTTPTGFAPAGAATPPCNKVVDRLDGAHWFIGGDIADCLDSSSHCPLAAGERVQQPAVAGWDLDTQALSPAGAHVDGTQLAALTRCNTVWRDTPSAMVASSTGSQPSGACSTNRPRSSSVIRMRRGAYRMGCSPAMNPSASQRCTVEGTTPRILVASVIVTSSPSGAMAGGW